MRRGGIGSGGAWACVLGTQFCVSAVHDAVHAGYTIFVDTALLHLVATNDYGIGLYNPISELSSPGAKKASKPSRSHEAFLTS